MPSPIVQFNSGVASGPGYNISFSNPVTVGNVLVAFSLLGEFGSPFVPTDNQGNTWVEPSETAGGYPAPAWYALNAKAGTTTLTFPGFSIDTWVILIEVSGWAQFDAFAITENDPPSVEEIDITTTVDNDLILAFFAGTNIDPSQIGLTAGVESTLLDTELAEYNGGSSTWSVLAEWQKAGAAALYPSTATFDSDFANYNFSMAIAFKSAKAAPAYAVTELPVQDSLALDSNVPTWENTLGQPYTSDESLPAVPAINLSCQPQDDGQVDLIYTPVPNTLSNTGVPLSFPPDFSIPVLYRALQILYSIQGEGADDRRAQYCGDRYEMLVAMSKSMAFMGRQKSGRSIRVKR